MSKNKSQSLRKPGQLSPFLHMPSALGDLFSDNFNMDFEKFFNHFHTRQLFFPHVV